MRSTIRRTFLLAAACLLAGQPVWGQQDAPEPHAMPRLEVAVLYDALLSNVVQADKFWMQGGSIQFEGQFWRGLGAEADVSGFHTQNANNVGVGLDMVTATFGPRYLWSSDNRRYSFFGHALVGEANGFNSIFPGAASASSSANSLALQIGGGMDLALRHRLSLRVFQVDWLRTTLPNADTNVQNNVRLASGVVIRFR